MDINILSKTTYCTLSKNSAQIYYSPHWPWKHHLLSPLQPQTVHTSLASKPKDCSRINWTPFLSWVTNPNMTSILWAMSQSMKSHNSSSTLPLLTTSLQLWTCRTDRPQTADSHYASLPGNVYHATPTWNTKINICEISSVYVFLISHLHMKQCIDLYKENMSRFSFPWSTQIQEPLTSWSFCYYHFCLLISLLISGHTLISL